MSLLSALASLASPLSVGFAGQKRVAGAPGSGPSFFPLIASLQRWISEALQAKPHAPSPNVPSPAWNTRGRSDDLPSRDALPPFDAPVLQDCAIPLLCNARPSASSPPQSVIDERWSFAWQEAIRCSHLHTASALRRATGLGNLVSLAYHSLNVKPHEPENERLRLAQVYASMGEGELRQVAENPQSLTEPAIEALKSEFARRNLEVSLEVSPDAEAHPNVPDLVILRRFGVLPDALLAKGALESAGIECFFDDDNIVRMDWFISNAVGGVKLLVRPQDAAAANEILEQKTPPTFDVADVGEYHQPRCPKCESLDVISEFVKKVREDLSAESGAGAPAIQTGWKCQSCGHVWPVSSDEVSNP